jgi:hypothetical protein
LLVAGQDLNLRPLGHNAQHGELPRASIADLPLTGFGMTFLAPAGLVADVEARRILDMTPAFCLIRKSHEFASGSAFGLRLTGALWRRIVRRGGVMQWISMLGRGVVK